MCFSRLAPGMPWNSHVTTFNPARPTCDGGPSPRVLSLSVVERGSRGSVLGWRLVAGSQDGKKPRRPDVGRSMLALPPSVWRRCCGCDETATAPTTTNPRSQCAHARPAGSGWPAVGSTPWRGNLEATQATRFWTGTQGAAPSSGGAASRWAGRSSRDRPTQRQHLPHARNAGHSKTTTQAHRYGIQ